MILFKKMIGQQAVHACSKSLPLSVMLVMYHTFLIY